MLTRHQQWSWLRYFKSRQTIKTSHWWPWWYLFALSHYKMACPPAVLLCGSAGASGTSLWWGLSYNTVTTVSIDSRSLWTLPTVAGWNLQTACVHVFHAFELLTHSSLRSKVLFWDQSHTLSWNTKDVHSFNNWWSDPTMRHRLCANRDDSHVVFFLKESTVGWHKQ